LTAGVLAFALLLVRRHRRRVDLSAMVGHMLTARSL
jgi:hypothetical protein